MAVKILSLMLVITQLMSWAAAPLRLCVSANGSICVELGDEDCTCCSRKLEKKSQQESHKCCAECEAEESEDNPFNVVKKECDCTHIPLMVEQDDSVRAQLNDGVKYWDTAVTWLSWQQHFVPRTISVVVLHWDRRIDRSRHPLALTTTVLRC